MGPLIQHMWDQEKVHKATFEKLIVEHRVRPTALTPVWNAVGYLLGAGEIQFQFPFFPFHQTYTNVFFLHSN